MLGRRWLAIPENCLRKSSASKPGFCIFVNGAPSAYDGIVGELPIDVKIAARLKAPVDMVHVFAMEAAGLAGRLRG